MVMDGEKRMSDREYAVSLDAQDPLSQFREEFLLPTKAQLRAKSLPEAGKMNQELLQPQHSLHLYYVLKGSRVGIPQPCII
jgi:hypothetical protein